MDKAIEKLEAVLASEDLRFDSETGQEIEAVIELLKA